MKLITEKQYKKVELQYETCQKMILRNPEGEISQIACNSPGTEITGNPPRFNLYDIRIPCKGTNCYEEQDELTTRFLNRADVKKALGVTGRIWKSCVTTVHSALAKQHNRSSVHDIVFILENNIKVLLYNGDEDFICNYL